MKLRILVAASMLFVTQACATAWQAAKIAFTVADVACIMAHDGEPPSDILRACPDLPPNSQAEAAQVASESKWRKMQAAQLAEEGCAEKRPMHTH